VAPPEQTLVVAKETKELLMRVAQDELGGVDANEALLTVLRQRQAFLDIERLHRDPDALAAYQEDTASLAEVDTGVVEAA